MSAASASAKFIAQPVDLPVPRSRAINCGSRRKIGLGLVEFGRIELHLHDPEL